MMKQIIKYAPSYPIFLIIFILILAGLIPPLQAGGLKNENLSPATKKLYKGINSDDYTQVRQALEAGADYTVKIKTNTSRSERLIDLAVVFYRQHALEAIIDHEGTADLMFYDSLNKLERPLIAEVFLRIYWWKHYNLYKSTYKRAPKNINNRFRSIADMLLDKNIQLNIIFKFPKYLNTLLSIASEYNDIEMIERLLNMGANPNLPHKRVNERSITLPLEHAILNRNLDMVKLLLSYRADIKHPEFGYKHVDEDIAFVMMEAGYDMKKNFALTIKKHHNRLFDYLLEKIDSLDFYPYDKDNYKSFNPVAHAIAYNNLHAYKALIKAGADPCMGIYADYVIRRMKAKPKIFKLEEMLQHIRKPMQEAGCEQILETGNG